MRWIAWKFLPRFICPSQLPKALHMSDREKIFRIRLPPIKGKGGDGIPFVSPPKQTKITIKGKYIGQVWLYSLGVDAGKATIMSSLKVQEAGPKFCHFPRAEEAGYDGAFFAGLLSEKLTLARTKAGTVWRWEKLPGHQRNEALDCRNYALAGLKIIDPDMEAAERRLKGWAEPAKKEQKRKPVRRQRPDDDYDW